MEEEGRVNGFGLSPGRRRSDWGSIALLDKTKEFFQTCDVEGKGFISRTDMRRLHRQLPLSAEELEDVFDSLDTDHTGYLTLEAFSSGFSQFLHGRRISVTDEQNPAPGHGIRAKEALYQSQWEAKLSGVDSEEEGHFCMLLESLGASNVFEDPGEVRSLWAQLRRDEPHLLSNFEEFLTRSATHDSEIRYLYEEMEAQIKNEKDRLILKRLQLRSVDLEHQLSSKEKELEHIFQKQKRLELQCRDLNSEKQESHVENVKLKMTNDELSRALENTSQELGLAQDQLGLLQEQAAQLQQEKEMEMYRVTEGLQREKQSLMKQLDLLREMNKHLKDERDICRGVPRTSLRKKQKQRAGLNNMFDDSSQPPKRAPLFVDGSYQSLEALPIELLQIVFVASSSCSEDDTPTPPSTVSTSTFQRPAGRKNFGLANGYAHPAPPKAHDVKAKAKKSPGKMAATKPVTGKERERAKRVDIKKKTGMEDEVLDAPPDGWPLRRVISIEEDHLPHLLLGGPQPLLHQLSEEEDEEDEEEDEEPQSDIETIVVIGEDLSASPSSNPVSAVASVRKSRFTRAKKMPMSPRGQPVGKETQQWSWWGTLVLARRPCSAPSVRAASTPPPLQLYRSITKQFFRKADGVVVMFDVTVQESFKAVKPWLTNVQSADGAGGQGERHHSGSECSAREEEGLLQVKGTLNLP
ncbi:hypothetical protein F7725_021618, partial [Dissostichus mawsoni]